MNVNEKLIDFLHHSPSSFHAVETVTRRLEAEGYIALPESTSWTVFPGGKYYVTRNQSSVIAFTVPATLARGFMICASHSDSPTFKIKANPEGESAGMYVRLNTERYGGMLCSTWLDRPLSVAGRVVAKQDGKIVSRTVCVDRDLLLIPNVAIHMMRGANDNMSYNANVDMFPLMGSTAVKGSFMKIVADEAGVKEEDIIASDLYLYNRTPASVWGADNEFISAPRLDDLQCSFASIPVLAILDNEEVGSQTKQGAASTFLYDVLARVCNALEMEYIPSISHSFLVSADNAHAVHPNHPEFADAHHRPKMNGGVVIKHNANQRYTTDAVSQAIFASICEAAGVPVQYFANRSDMAGGSTLGNIATTQVSLNAVDIGLAQLAMHSSYETAGAKDTEYLITALSRFYSSALTILGDGEYVIE